MKNVPSPEYDSELRAVLERGDWEALRDFTRKHNEIPDDIYQQEQHFWEILLHKLVCNRIDMMGMHDASREWLERHGYTADLGGF